MKRLVGSLMLLAAPLMVAGGVLVIVRWAEDRTLAFAGQITLGLVVGAMGIVAAGVGISLLRGRL